MAQGITRTTIATTCTSCGTETPGPRTRIGVGNVMLVLCATCLAALHRKTAPATEDRDWSEPT